MFKLQPNPTFWKKVGIYVPGEEARAEIEIEFKFLGRKEVVDFFAGLPAVTEPKLDADGKVIGEKVIREAKKDPESLSEIIVNWKGPDVEYSPEALARLINNYPNAAWDLFEGFRTELLEVKRKN